MLLAAQAIVVRHRQAGIAEVLGAHCAAEAVPLLVPLVWRLPCPLLLLLLLLALDERAAASRAAQDVVHA